MEQDFSIRPSIGLEERYDSNPGLRSDNVAEDYVTSVVPQIEISRAREGLELIGSYKLATRYYSRQPELNYISHAASLKLSDVLTPTTKLTVSDTFALTDDALETAESREATGIVIKRTSILSNNASIALSHDVGPRYSLIVEYSDLLTEFDDATLTDSRADSVSIESRWNQARNLVFTMKYGYTYFSFKNHGRNSIDEHSLLLGLEEQVSPTLAVKISGGAAYLEDVNNDFFSAGEVSILKNFKGSTARLSYSRSATTSFGLTNEISINDRVYLTSDLLLDRSFKISLSGVYSQSKSEPTARLDIKSFEAGIGGEWVASKWLKANVGYSHFNQWGKDPSGGDIKRDQVYVSLTAATDERRF